ncbi:hypothetical protein QR680_017900 [Steinernema hermaphroditum]|uniref:Uncharacterized protein n=1 Tax=Steinernema hermaphroditum TaxID=289476 RepID=A0AA39HGY2_9BILA|nr:hypothetical protein QR680_017900 [Steinernema hermaphroditum]
MIEDHANPVAYAIAEVLDGKIYVVGGGAADKFFNSVRIFDPAAMQWRSSAPSMKIPRCYPSSAVLNGKLFVIGGFDGSQRTNSVEFYNPKTNAWKAAARMLERRSDSAAAVMNGFLYVFGGVSITNVLDTVERYDPATNRWTFIGTMPHKASGVTAIAWEGEILLIGGSDDGVRLKNVLRFTKHHTRSSALSKPFSIGLSHYQHKDDIIVTMGGAECTE